MVTNLMANITGAIRLHLHGVRAGTGEAVLGFILGYAEVAAGGRRAGHVEC